ncbi:MAG: TonB-dependent receptor [Candidatus Kapaibacterium sp.]
MKVFRADCWILAFIAFITPLLLPHSLRSQDRESGELRGRVLDRASGEPIPGVTVLIRETTSGGATDMNGVYSLRHLTVGTYSVEFRSVGYTTQVITDVTINSGVNLLDIALHDSALVTNEVVLTARRRMGTEGALLSLRRTSATMDDGISTEQIRRSPDATSGDALARVTGLSILDKKFVSVRGANERYNNTRLDGVSLPSTDPDKKSFSFDMFPANLLENMIVSKTYTPDLPGDFTGGLVQLNTTDFPDRRTLKLAVSLGYDGQTTFEKADLPKSGKTDWLGIDDGARTLPENFPSSELFHDSLSLSQKAEWGRELSNNWVPSEISVPLNSGFILSYGDRFQLFENDFGVLASLSYRNSYSTEQIFRRDTGRFAYPGVQSEYSTLWGGVFNLNYKLSDMHSIGVRNVYSRTSENSRTILEGTDFYNSQTRRLSGLYYLERDFYSGQITGGHYFPTVGGLRLNWKGFASTANRDEPDYRRFMYFRDAFDTTAPFRSAISQAPSHTVTGRFFSHLEEDVYGYGGDLTLPVSKVKLKGGGLIEKKSREFAARAFAYGSRNPAYQFTDASLDTLLNPENIDSNKIFFVEQTKPLDNYTAESTLEAAYLMADIPFEILGAKFRTIVGGRVENARQELNSVARDDSTRVSVDNLDTDILPSINLIYVVTDRLNIRGAFSKTVTRPEFRELAPFVFYDFTTDQNIYGNPDLRRSLATNYDLRVEFFPDVREVLAVSLFHKKIEGAIEAVAITGGIPERTWDNADRATNTGVELELRKSLGFVHSIFSNLSVSVNYTWLESHVDVVGDSLRAGKNGRRLQGQSPYIINAGLYYDNVEVGTSVSLLFNRFGSRITEVANTDQPDFIEQPRSLLDLSISQRIISRIEAKLSFRNMLGEDVTFTQDGIPSRVNSKDQSISLGLSWSL